jgi:hypothetical protein
MKNTILKSKSKEKMNMILLVILLLTILTGCGRKEQTQSDFIPDLDEQQAKYFAGYTAEIQHNQPIIIRFSKKIPFPIGAYIGAIKLQPELNCKMQVKNDLEVEITPIRQFQQSSYLLVIDMASIFKQDIAPISLPVKIKERELIKLETNFEMEQNLRRFKAAFAFDDHTIRMETLEKAISLKLDDKQITYKLKKDTFDSQLWLLESEQFIPGSSQAIHIQFEKDLLLLKNSIERSFLLPERVDLIVQNIYYEKVGANYVIIVAFSENLNFEQDISEFIKVKGIDEIHIAKLENRIHIEGNFVTSEQYEVQVKKGIRSNQSFELKKDEIRTIQIKNELANLMFTEQGNILTSMGNKKIRFRSVNVKQATLRVKKVYENNLGFFLQEQKISGQSRYYYNFNRVGVQVYHNKITIDSELNHWVENEIDLNKLLEQDKTGLYIIELSYQRNDCIGENHNSGDVTKNVMISDLALTVKQGKESVVIATDLTNNRPAANANITIYNYQNQILVSGKTNAQGMFRYSLDGKIEDFEYDYFETDNSVPNSIHYLLGEFKDSKAYLNYREMQWNISTFDIQGYDYPEKGSAFVYTERGVYRPGDEINFTIILRNKQNTFPEKQPVLLEILDPTLSKQLKTTLTSGKDGVFNYSYTPDENYKTGNWQLHYETGGIKGIFQFKVETVVAERLKVTIEPEFREMNFAQLSNKIKVNAMYLFGSPANDLTTKVTASFESKSKQFTVFPGFSFYNQTIDFKQPKLTILAGTTDAEGNAEKVWQRPDFLAAPCDIIVELETEVIDKGGRASKAKEFINIEPYQYYAGLKLSEKMITFQDGSFEILLVDAEGKAIVGEQMEINVYQNDRYWWWEHNWEGNYSQSFKQTRDSKLVFSQTVTSENSPKKIQIGKVFYGKYLVEVAHKVKNGHIASQFFYPRWWGETQGGIMDIGVMQLRSNKAEYLSGEDVIIQFDAPEQCRVLVSLEDSDVVRNIWWEQPLVTDGKATITIKTDETMIPNVYCSISVLQKVSNSNDLPIRSYGTIPIKVVDIKTVNNITIKTLETIKPNSVFPVEIQTQQKRKSQITVSVVDEGLLSLTNFRSPDPWNHFFRKRLLKIKSYDTYGFVMGISKGDVFKSFSVGGDAFDMDMAKSIMEKRKEITDLLQKTMKRFEPVCLYSGILETDEKGYLKTEFTMPQYIGAVRIMAVSVSGNAYGFGEKTVPVKDKIMVQATLPRFASPGDSFFIPVEIFVDDEQIKEVNLVVKTEGPVIISGKQSFTLKFNKIGSQIINIPAETAAEIGFAKLEFALSAGKHTNRQQVNLPVYPSQPSIYKGETKVLERGKEVKFLIPQDGYKGSMTADIQIAKLMKLNLSNRVNWLIKYPYGCLEQVTSTAFPQLFLKDLLINKNFSASEMDVNINGGIKKLRDYQLPDGSLGYWPGNRETTHWGTNYALHFLLEARKQGYYVSPDFINGMVTWLSRKTTATIPQTVYEYANQTYSLYLLALAEKPNIQGMNILYETYLNKLPTTYQWLLAATYQMVGKPEIAKSIEAKITETQISQAEMQEYYRFSWGTNLRDEAMILLAYNLLNKKKEAFDMFHYIAEKISDSNWYATQTLSYCLTALGDYYRKNSGEFNNGEVSGTIVFSDGSIQAFKSDKITFHIPITEQFGKEVKVRLNSDTKQENVFVTMNWTGVPEIDFLPKEFNGLSLRTEFFNDSNQLINPDIIKQGEVLQMKITVKNISDKSLENIALTQYLPAGWEIENERLIPTFSANKPKTEYDYLDIRDDKIIWFFDLKSKTESKSFSFKIRAVTRGNFKLPSTYCEAMYYHDINATLPGRLVQVTEAK